MPLDVIRKGARELFTGISSIKSLPAGGCEVEYDNGDTMQFLQSANVVAGEMALFEDVLSLEAA